MEEFIRKQVLLWSIALLILGCNSIDQIKPESSLSEIEQSMVGNWRYLEIEANGSIYYFADYYLEPGTQIVTTIGQRTALTRKYINYSDVKTYQLRWVDRGNYQLGTDGEANWQPNYGSWTYDEESDSLVHNKGLYYNVKYKVSVNGNRMTRTSLRVMTSDYDEFLGRTWNNGDTVLFREKFIRVN